MTSLYNLEQWNSNAGQFIILKGLYLNITDMMMQYKVLQGSSDVWISNLCTELMQYCSCDAAVHYYTLLIFSSLILI